MGPVDRLVRALVVAPVLIALGWASGGGDVLGVVAFVLAGVMLATAVVGFCPAYLPFGISTRGGVSTPAAPSAAPPGTEERGGDGGHRIGSSRR